MSDDLEHLRGPTEDHELSCPACGATATRATARFCATCGRRLDHDYFPTDSLLSSYHQQRRDRPATERGDARTFVRVERSRDARIAAMALKSGENNSARTALAFATYALVPYLGILFCPGALFLGGVGLLRARRSPHIGGQRSSATSIVLGFLLLCVQIFLWWILYKVPEWTRP